MMKDIVVVMYYSPVLFLYLEIHLFAVIYHVVVNVVLVMYHSSVLHFVQLHLSLMFYQSVCSGD